MQLDVLQPVIVLESLRRRVARRQETLGQAWPGVGRELRQVAGRADAVSGLAGGVAHLPAAAVAAGNTGLTTAWQGQNGHHKRTTSINYSLLTLAPSDL